jgi:hypothetical protein
MASRTTRRGRPGRRSRRSGRVLPRRELVQRFEVRRIRLSSQGYDRSGRYYGTGAPLYSVYDSDTGDGYETRASSAEQARQRAIAHWTKTKNWSGEYGRQVWSPFAPTVTERY